MGESDEQLLKCIRHYQDSLERHTEKRNDAKLQHAIDKLYRLPIKVSHLEATGVGRTVNSLRKLGGDVSNAAKSLVSKWKEMVVVEDTDKNDDEDEDSGTSLTEDDRPRSDYKHREREDSRNDRKHSTKEKSYATVDHKRKHRESDDNDEDDSGDSASDDEDYNKNKNKVVTDSSDSEEDSSDRKKRKHKHVSSDSENSEEEVRHKSKKSKSSRDDSDDKSSRHKTKKSKRDVEHDEERSHSKIKNKSSHHRHDSDSDDKHSRHDKDRAKSESKSSKESSRSSKHSEKNSDNKHSKHRQEKSEHKKETREKSSSSKHESKSSEKESKSSSKDSERKSKNRERENKAGDKDSKHKESRSSDKSSKEHKKEDKHTDKVKSGDKSNKEDSKQSHDSGSSKKTSSSSSSKNGHEKNDSKEKKKSISSKEKKVDSPVLFAPDKTINGIDSASGASFADALGMCAPLPSKKKSSTDKAKVSSSSSSSSTSRTEKSNKTEKQSPVIPKLLNEPVNEPLDISIESLLPSITPNYRPLGNIGFDNQVKRTLTDYEALSRVISSKNQRTKVYSGNKVVWGKLPSLFELCVRVLQDNIDALEYTGGVPYSILKPILEKANPDQLYMMEHHNPYLIEDTDELWQLHCQKEFKTKVREEMETWRDMYIRCLEEREAKLKALTANIKMSQDKSLPVRTTKLAYVDSIVKPPRDVVRKQMKNGTTFDKKPALTPASRLTALATAGEAGKVAVPSPGVRAAESSRHSSSSAMKPKKAPLMQKTLSFMKNRFKR